MMFFGTGHYFITLFHGVVLLPVAGLGRFFNGNFL